MALIKLLSLFLSLLFYFYLFVFGPFKSNIFVLTTLLVILIIFHLQRLKYKYTKSALTMVFFMVFILLIFGFIFQLVKLFGRTDWLLDSYQKALVFPNTLLFVNILISFLKFKDIVLLPITFRNKIILIIIKSLFYRGNNVIERFEWYLNTYPYMSSDNKYFENKIYIYDSLLISLFLFLNDESKKCWFILLNRYNHLEGVSK